MSKFKVTIKNPNPIFEPEVEICDNLNKALTLLTNALNKCPLLTYIVEPIEVESETKADNHDRFADRKYHYTFNKIECNMQETRGYLAKVLSSEYAKSRKWVVTTYEKGTIANAFDWLLEKLCLDDNIDFDRVIEEYWEEIKDEVMRDYE